jgi:hypothetical protein
MGLHHAERGGKISNGIFLCTGGVSDEFFLYFQDLRYNNQIQIHFPPLLRHGVRVLKRRL